MERLSEWIKILVPLLAGVYLGFYVFGVVMSVFDPVDRAWLTAIAAVCVLGLIAYMVARRCGIHPIAQDSPLARAAHAERERRGY
ncbi:MAG: hypothetical protein QOI10_821 [Solirubrobacterales bacterium]|jgi:hypothetical protein|nr:hypothetical protein [Solirubrobacterales bacterium]